MKNDLVGGEYVEPYAGGAGIGLFLAIEEYAEHVHLNDLDRSIFAFWYAVTKNPDELCHLIEATDVTISEWKRQRDKQKQLRSKSGLSKSDLLDLGFSTFFLNRTNRSGIIRGGGVIGGVDQDGEWGIKARYNKESLIKRIRRIAKCRDRISVYNWPASKFISKKVPELSSQSLVYLDPPYYESGQNLYQNGYEIEDHERISDRVKNTNKSWIVSYDNSEDVKKLYEGCEKITYSLSYSARRRYEGSEVMFISEDIDLPEFDNPARISKDRVRRCRKEYHQENAFQDSR